MTLEALAAAEFEEAAAFLTRVWRRSYGDQPFPVFTPEYLQWLYGGPDAHRARLFGVRKNGNLVACKGYLPRDLVVQGQRRCGYISTHLAVDRPAVDSVAPYVEVLTVEIWRDPSLLPDLELTYSLFDLNKRIADRSAALYVENGIGIAHSFLGQTLVSPRRPSPPDDGARVRRATADDATAIAALLTEQADGCDIGRRFTPATVRHHWFHAPGAEIFVADEGGEISGALAVYRLETMSPQRQDVTAICEGVVGASEGVLRSLFDAAVDYQRRIGARGVVCENASYLPPDVQRACGLVPSLRQMRFAVTSRDVVDIGTRWMVDIK